MQTRLQTSYKEGLKELREEQFWLELMDAIVCGEEEYLSRQPEITVCAAKGILEAAKMAKKGQYWDIYGRFAQNYHLGWYRDSE